MHIAIGTKNKAKIAAVISVVSNVTYEAVSVSSNVASQPLSDEETMRGAINRAKAALAVTSATIGFGLEGGITKHGDTWYICNWVALATRDVTFIASGAKLPLPTLIAEAVLAGQELGDVMVALQHNDTRQSLGAIGVLTAGRITREQMFSDVVQLVVGQYEASQQEG